MRRPSKRVLRGGCCYLLSYVLFVGALAAQEGFLKMKDPESGSYGTVGSPVLPYEVVNQLSEADMSFSDWSSFFSVKISQEARPILGTYSLQQGRVLFQPRFLPDPRISYVISFDRTELLRQLELDYSGQTNRVHMDTVRFPAMITERTVVQGTYPDAGAIPMNTLRMYLYFSQPMGFLNPYDFIELLDANSQVVTNAFVELPQGLWNDDRTRLTVLFHPGRVKQGVGPNREEGAVLSTQQTYQLAISPDWLDANGNELAQGFAAEFHVSEARRNKLDVDDWLIAGSCNPGCEIAIEQDAFLDIELFEKMIAITNETGGQIPFSFQVSGDNRLLIRSPEFLRGASYELQINPRLEDMSGNTFLNAFDTEKNTRIYAGKPLRIVVKME